jgi:hypothetical protein
MREKTLKTCYFTKMGVKLHIILIILLIVLVLPTSKVYANGPIVISEENPAIDNVIAAFDALTYHGEWLGFHMSDPTSGEYAPDTYPPPGDEHIQGIARSPQTGKPIFYVTRSGNLDNPDYYGSLMVVEMGTRDTDGERLRSNRLLKGEETRTTPPHTMDRVIKNIPYSDWEHPGGIQMSGDILAVPLEKPANIYLPQGRIIFYDCSTPESPIELAYTLDFPTNHVGVLGFTKLPNSDNSDGHFFIAVSWGDGEEIEFYRSNKTSFFDANGDEDPEFKFEFHSELNRSDLELLVYDGFWQFGKTTPQTLNFVTQRDGKLYLITSSNTHEWTPMFNGWDLMYLIEVTGFGVDEEVEFTGIRGVEIIIPPGIIISADAHKKLSSEGCWRTWTSGGITVSQNMQANFNASGGAYVSPTGELLYYSTSYYNKGPYGTVKMAELRHNWVSSSGTCGPQFHDNHLGGPYNIDEETSITLSGEAYLDGHCMEPWVQMFDDVYFEGQMVMMDFSDQFSDDYNDFKKLDGCATPLPDGFNDQLSSFRFNGPPGSVLLLFDDDNYRIGNTSYPPVPGTGKVMEVPFVGSYFNDEATSALLLWNGYSSQPYSWDLDNDGEFDDAFSPEAIFQAGSGSSTNIVRMKYVYSDAWTFTGLGVPIPFPETYAIFETTINVGATLIVDAGLDATIGEGDTFASSGFFTDQDDDTWTAIVDYSDGSGIQALTLNPDKTFNLSHTYRDNGEYTVTVTASADDGDVNSDVVVVTVKNVAPIVNAGPDISASSVQGIDISAGFNDPGVNDNPWSFMIDWGDDSPITIGSSDIQGADTVSGTHQYFLPGFYTIKVTVIDKDGGIGIDTLLVEVESVPVNIDIKPGSDTNSINPHSNGVIPVAILTDDDFDATTVRGETCRFGPTQAIPRHYNVEDVDGDGDLDMILHFPTQETGLTFSDTEAILTGQTTDGRYISGTDVVRMVPAKGKMGPKGKDDAPGQNKEPSDNAGGKAIGKDNTPGQNKEPGDKADGKAIGKENAPGQNKEPGESATGKGKNKT